MKRGLTEKQIKSLFEQYYITLVEFSWHFVKCREAALDVVQDTFVKILERSDELPTQESALKSYLYSTVRNASLNHLRHQKVRVEYYHSKTLNDLDEDHVLAAMIHAETISILYKAIETLPKSCQKICRLTYLEGKTNNEAAELCDVSINTIKTQKRRSVELLRHRLSPVINSIKTIVFFFF